MPKVRMTVAETRHHIITVDMTDDMVEEFQQANEYIGGEMASDYLSRNTLEDGSFELEEFEVLPS